MAALFRKSEPINPMREEVARHLRVADDYTRKLQFDEALFEIQEALKLDPKNNNARQFFERVKVQQKRNQELKKPKEEATGISLEERMDIISRHLVAAEQLVEERHYPGALTELAKVYKIDSKNYYAQAISARIDQLMADESSGIARGTKAGEPHKKAEVKKENGVRGSTLFYSELLKLYWFDGKITPDEDKHLTDVRDLFAISRQDHEQLTRKVKFDAYVEALRIAWVDGVLTKMERHILESMRVKYDISPAENQRAEELVAKLRVDHPTRAAALIVDADRDHAVGLAKALKTYGYNPILTQNPDDALSFLQHDTPAVILADIKFPGTTTDGFDFFRRTQESPRMRHIPFIFTVRIQKKDLLLAALRVGVDSVLLKPADPEFVVAVIEGKKRRREC